MAHFDAPVSTIYRGLVSGKTVTTIGRITAGAGALLRGQVMKGAVGAAWAKSATGADANGVLAQDVDATAADVLAPIIIQGWVKVNALIGVTNVAGTTENLRKSGIYCETVEETTGLIIRGETSTVALAAEVQAAPGAAAEGPAMVGEEVALRHAEGAEALDSLTGDLKKASQKAAASAKEEQDKAAAEARRQAAQNPATPEKQQPEGGRRGLRRDTE